MPRLAACAGALVAAATIAAAATAPAAGAATAARTARSAAPVTVVTLSAVGTSTILKKIKCEMVFIGEHGGVPHHSGHVPGTVNVRVRVTCSRPIARIKGKIGLFSDNGSKINNYGSVGSAKARGNAALKCSPGYYVGESSATLTAPPGYTPHTATLTDQTAEVHIKKC